MMVRGGLTRSQYGETSEALYLNSGFVYDSPEATVRPHGGRGSPAISIRATPTRLCACSRNASPSSKAQRIAARPLSGMAAIHTMLVAPVKPGDRIVAPRQLFSSVVWILKNVMPKMGVEVTWVDGSDLGQWEKAMKKPCRFSIIETPSNPLLDAVDIRAVANLTHSAGGELIVDNVFASPILQKPLELDADWVVYSTTKHMDGQGRTLGGAILGKTKAIEDQIQQYYRHTGPSMSPFNAWVVLKGLETMDLRVRRMSANARAIADRLAAQQARSPPCAIPGRERSPAPQHPRLADGRRGLDAGALDQGRTDAAYAALEQARPDRHLQQSGRFEVADNPPGDDDAPHADG